MSQVITRLAFTSCRSNHHPAHPRGRLARNPLRVQTAIHWFRRDLRLSDNTALNAAAAAAEAVVPVFILSTWQGQHHWTGPNRQEFLCACLQSLDKNLEAIGGRLVIREGPAERALEQLVAETSAQAIFYNRDPDPFGRAVEAKVQTLAERLGITVSAHKDVALHERDELLSGSGQPYRVYAPYFKAWSKKPKPAVGPRLKRLSVPAVSSLPLPTLAHWKLKSEGARLIEAGERAARLRLRKFMSAQGTAATYAVGRTILTGETTSRFSQDLRWGLLSVRELCHQARALADELDQRGRENVEKFLGEIAWRDFYFQVLYHFPQILDDDFNPAMRGLPWRQAGDHAAAFERWCTGTTGFPIVDAGMRQLSALGFMHNRLRMIVSMFLTKDLRIYWREGEAFFMRKLVDGEIASNNGGWQWSAGTGADAAPYFRIQNPWTQSQRFDPNGDYIKDVGAGTARRAAGTPAYAAGHERTTAGEGLSAAHAGPRQGARPDPGDVQAASRGQASRKTAGIVGQAARLPCDGAPDANAKRECPVTAGGPPALQPIRASGRARATSSPDRAHAGRRGRARAASARDRPGGGRPGRWRRRRVRDSHR